MIEALDRFVCERVASGKYENGSEAAATAADPDAVVVHVIPLLVETDQADRFDRVVVVDIDPRRNSSGSLALRSMDPVEARQRMAAQADPAERLAIADEVIDNSGSVDQLRGQVDALWERLSGIS